MNSRPRFGLVEGCGSTTSFIGWVTTGASLRSGVGSTWLKSADRPPTLTDDTSRTSWKSRLNSLSLCVAVATILVFADVCRLPRGRSRG